VTTQSLCVADAANDPAPVCVTKGQLAALLSQSGQAETPGSVSSSGGGDLTNSANSPHANQSASSTPTGAPPTIHINGDNPAIIHVGDSYADLGATITGTTEADRNLGIKYFLNGQLVSNIVLDASKAATDTIDYVAPDPNGLTATSTRTVIIEAAALPSPPPPAVASSTPAATASSTVQ
jgi:hypothetical protein